MHPLDFYTQPYRGRLGWTFERQFVFSLCTLRMSSFLIMILSYTCCTELTMWYTFQRAGKEIVDWQDLKSSRPGLHSRYRNSFSSYCWFHCCVYSDEGLAYLPAIDCAEVRSLTNHEITFNVVLREKQQEDDSISLPVGCSFLSLTYRDCKRSLKGHIYEKFSGHQGMKQQD